MIGSEPWYKRALSTDLATLELEVRRNPNDSEVLQRYITTLSRLGKGTPLEILEGLARTLYPSRNHPGLFLPSNLWSMLWDASRQEHRFPNVDLMWVNGGKVAPRKGHDIITPLVKREVHEFRGPSLRSTSSTIEESLIFTIQWLADLKTISRDFRQLMPGIPAVELRNFFGDMQFLYRGASEIPEARPHHWESSFLVQFDLTPGDFSKLWGWAMEERGLWK